MFASKFFSKTLLTFATTFALAGFFTNAFAQGYFPGSGEEDNENESSCVGDGCGLVFPNQDEQANNTPSEIASEISSSNEAEAATQSGDSTSVAAVDSSKVTHEDEEDDGRPYYINESASEYEARKEGFSKSLTFGVRAGGGMNFTFGKKASGWNMDFEGNAGIVGRLPLYRKTLGVQAELDFTYRRYNYEKDVSYGHNKAEIKEIIVDIPVMLQYFFDQDGLFINFGLNLGLKMGGESIFRQTIDTEDQYTKDKRSNTLPTAGVELGGLIDIGYPITRWMIVDLRIVQNFTNMLDMDYIAESKIMGSKLYTLHTTLGLFFPI